LIKLFFNMSHYDNCYWKTINLLIVYLICFVVWNLTLWRHVYKTYTSVLDLFGSVPVGNYRYLVSKIRIFPFNTHNLEMSSKYSSKFTKVISAKHTVLEKPIKWRCQLICVTSQTINYMNFFHHFFLWRIRIRSRILFQKSWL